MNNLIRFLGLFLLTISMTQASSVNVFIRFNQLGYTPQDAKIAIAMSKHKIEGDFKLIDMATGGQVFKGVLRQSSGKVWGNFPYHYDLDFSGFRDAGSYRIIIPSSGDSSAVFPINENTFSPYADQMLEFMRQQRCGYNPYLDMVCHQRDGRTFYGPMPDSTYIDASGGWHDAGDQLKYLITASFASAAMLVAWELAPQHFADKVDDLGHPAPNGIADVLDEAKWGLDWIHHLHPKADQLFHQVADDRDHHGWKWPDRDSSDYGWGPNSYRALYFADGNPQGLLQYKSKATGVANLAGRSAAAMAIGYRIWKYKLNSPAFAEKCLQAAVELYKMGRKQEGYQQGNSYHAPYRYTEDTWADDMEWAAAELYAATKDKHYLDEAKQYAEQIAATSWMQHDSTEHYQFYPFINLGHYALSKFVDDEFKAKLAAYYRDGIEHTLQRAKKNSFRIGVPFIWCSNNLVTTLITQIALYEKMTGDRKYHTFMLEQRDWLFGRNHWGTTMFTGIPGDGEYPEDVHTSVWHFTHKVVRGGLVDGPISAYLFAQLRGLRLLQPDEFADFQTDVVVYHDDIGDYSTNEPTMDGTAGAILMMAAMLSDAR